jgi:antitoxin component of RelBE/YafQ-DinJ toxin-antitoxin module
MKIQTAFRLDEQLIEELKLEAKRNKRSLNNYVEYVLSKIIEKGPNRETIQAIEDARADRDIEKIEDVDDFLKSL